MGLTRMETSTTPSLPITQVMVYLQEYFNWSLARPRHEGGGVVVRWSWNFTVDIRQSKCCDRLLRHTGPQVGRGIPCLSYLNFVTLFFFTLHFAAALTGKYRSINGEVGPSRPAAGVLREHRRKMQCVTHVNALTAWAENDHLGSPIGSCMPECGGLKPVTCVDLPHSGALVICDLTNCDP